MTCKQSQGRDNNHGERIALGLLTQQDALAARELATALELATTEALQACLKRLLEWGLIKSAGARRPHAIL